MAWAILALGQVVFGTICCLILFLIAKALKSFFETHSTEEPFDCAEVESYLLLHLLSGYNPFY